jgi:hypothetical protein
MKNEYDNSREDANEEVKRLTKKTHHILMSKTIWTRTAVALTSSRNR